MAEGFVYILTNEFMPGIVKIGYTNRTPEQRAWELYEKRTGVPGKFHVAFRFKCRDAKTLEHKVHRKLDAHRINAYREYFRVDVSHAISVINDLGVSHQTEPKQPAIEARESERDVERSSAPVNSNPSVKTTCAEPPKPALSLHRLRDDYETACADADRNSRAAAAVIVIVFIAPLTVFINDQIVRAGTTERSIWTLAIGALVTYSLLRRIIGKFKRAKIEEQYRSKIER